MTGLAAVHIFEFTDFDSKPAIPALDLSMSLLYHNSEILWDIYAFFPSSECML